MSPTKPTRIPGAKKSKKPLLIAGVTVLVVAGGVVGASVLLSNSKPTPRPKASQSLIPGDPRLMGTPFAMAGCHKPVEPKYQGRIKIKPGQKHPAYASTPPISGWFLPPSTPGYFGILPPIERIMSIVANGGIAIWAGHEDSTAARQWFNLSHRNDVVVLDDPNHTSGAYYVAWGFFTRCDHFSGDFATKFLQANNNMKAVKVKEPTAKPDEF